VAVHRVYRDWSAEDDARLTALLAAGEGPTAIAIKLERVSASVCRRINRLGLVRPKKSRAKPAAETTPIPLKEDQRKCMCCGAVFTSAGPHNRLCGRCRSKAGDFSPLHP